MNFWVVSMGMRTRGQDKWKSVSRVRCFATLWTGPSRLPLCWATQTGILGWVAIIINTMQLVPTPPPHPTSESFRKPETMGLHSTTTLYCTGRPHSSRGHRGLSKSINMKNVLWTVIKGSRSWANPTPHLDSPFILLITSIPPHPHQVLKQGPDLEAFSADISFFTCRFQSLKLVWV